MSKLSTNLMAGQLGHAKMHNDERARINAFCVLPAPVGTASENVAAIAAAIASVTDAQGNMGTVTLGPGTWALNGTTGIELRGKFGGVLQGVGEATRLRWTGDAAGDIVKIAHCQRVVLRDMQIGCAAPAVSAIRILRDNAPTNNPAPTKTRVERVAIDGRINNAPSLLIGVYVGGGVDANNDFNVFTGVEVFGYTKAAFQFVGSQSYGNSMYDCHAWGAGVGEFGVWTGNGTGGTFSCYGGSIGGNTVADFRVSRNSYYPFRIVGVNSENSEMFLDASGNDVRTVIVDGCRWAGNTSVNHIIMKIAGWSRIDVSNCHFGDGPNPTASNVIQYTPGAGVGKHFRFARNIVFSSALVVFPNTLPEEMLGNLQYTSEANGIAVNLTV